MSGAGGVLWIKSQSWALPGPPDVRLTGPHDLM
jgi:hypothetical protein